MRTRFAPSPTGPLHLGHAFSALTAFDMAEAAGGTFLLRIEDIDRSRARPEWEAQIETDLAWLDIRWPGPVRRQSDHLDAYRRALQTLWDRGFLYPCSCSRRDILTALDAPQEGVTHGPDGPVYPGTCRPAAPPSGPLPVDAALRIDMRKAVQAIDGKSLGFTETGPRHAGTVHLSPDHLLTHVGDVVLARRDMGTSYHLSVCVDDAAQEVTHVVRGEDLFDATAIHVLLQRLLDLPSPVYHHHRLIRDAAGRRLAKRDDARAIARYREDGLTSGDLRARLGLSRAPAP
ncbi:tRNA glutamyl-Q(34) synthetase GluQRS [Roseivivax isoporae]|uniref:Glutamyl-Q tRNA(Asp) ligase n=1 Tax=Roseivivax isoporae LMG 25204 TaxID=1449351 RepID=X7FAS6_9RHOB|nr:tRNA glutamyl-Q(34) synthetase GluQRS [Roseivivax isoporae]ETX29823.1 glutamyl-Q tRNA(Asp) ligase [Roseivivax isoporae LMG 25204]